MALHRLNIFSPAKETINKMKSKDTEWKKIFVNHLSAKVLVSKIYVDIY
jgi:molybdopterin synthase catalytic subunit